MEMAARNPGIDLDLSWVDSVRVNKPAVFKRANEIRTRRAVKKNYQIALLLKAAMCIDLTTQSGYDHDTIIICVFLQFVVKASTNLEFCGQAFIHSCVDFLTPSDLPAGRCLVITGPKIDDKEYPESLFRVAWLLKAATCIDLTTLSGDDTITNVQRLCFKAKNPIRRDLLEAVQMQHRGLTVGAVCVYPSRVSDAVNALKQAGAPQIPVASVATGFPAGQTPFKTRLAEIQMAVADGAKEIDIVINRAYALAGNWKGVYDEVKAFREACGDAHLKTILATGELGTLVNVYKASIVCMMAGSDFIKTSTGKEGVNAILPVGLVMVRAIRDYYQRTGYKVGFKPAGGIRTAKDSCTWLSLMKEELGNDWLTPELFRIGASSLLGDIERQIYHNVTGRYAAANELAMA